MKQGLVKVHTNQFQFGEMGKAAEGAQGVRDNGELLAKGQETH